MKQRPQDALWQNTLSGRLATKCRLTWNAFPDESSAKAQRLRTTRPVLSCSRDQNGVVLGLSSDTLNRDL
jgi:hypothetical protein